MSEISHLLFFSVKDFMKTKIHKHNFAFSEEMNKLIYAIAEKKKWKIVTVITEAVELLAKKEELK